MIRNISLALVLFSAILAFGVSAWAQKEKINLNTADSLQLQELPGIGPALARRILDFRRENGRFKRVEELMNVRGIGEKKFEKLSDRVTVGAAEKKAQPPEKKPSGLPAARKSHNQGHTLIASTACRRLGIPHLGRDQQHAESR